MDNQTTSLMVAITQHIVGTEYIEQGHPKTDLFTGGRLLRQIPFLRRFVMFLLILFLVFYWLIDVH